MDELTQRLEYLLERLRTTYDGIGHSSGRPYVYLVYPPDQERAMRRLADEHLHNTDALCFYHLDLLPITIAALAGQEERRQQLLQDPTKGKGASESILRLWGRQVSRTVQEELSTGACGRPVVVLRGLAALHPLGNPTSLMEAVAESEPRDPATGQIVPFVLLVPGVRPPGTSRTYLFLGREDLRLEFYRGEEV
ncbi:MAG: hypothetical protein JXM73_25120 [Anaerolineae bacterium]|nr:hypothetical protein [Anaerolineae bacterium]